jgi:hypothetical protein
LPRSWQRGEDGLVPEQDLEQRRQIADQFYIAAGNPRQQPVRRQPAERDGKANDGGEEDADNGHDQRIQQADEEYANVAVRPRIGNQALVDVKACIVLQEAEA